MEKSDIEIIEALKQKAQYHESMANKYKKAIEALYDMPSESNVSSKRAYPVTTGVISVVEDPKADAMIKPFTPTFEEVVYSLFNDGVPKTTSELRAMYNSATGRNIDAESFSGRFSGAVKKGRLKKHTIPENPLDVRFYYGKAEWFDGDVLKEAYLPYIKKFEVPQQSIYNTVYLK